MCRRKVSPELPPNIFGKLLQEGAGLTAPSNDNTRSIIKKTYREIDVFLRLDFESSKKKFFPQSFIYILMNVNKLIKANLSLITIELPCFFNSINFNNFLLILLFCNGKQIIQA